MSRDLNIAAGIVGAFDRGANRWLARKDARTEAQEAIDAQNRLFNQQMGIEQFRSQADLDRDAARNRYEQESWAPPVEGRPETRAWAPGPGGTGFASQTQEIKDETGKTIGWQMGPREVVIPAVEARPGGYNWQLTNQKAIADDAKSRRDALEAERLHGLPTYRDLNPRARGGDGGGGGGNSKTQNINSDNARALMKEMRESHVLKTMIPGIDEYGDHVNVPHYEQIPVEEWTPAEKDEYNSLYNVSITGLSGVQPRAVTQPSGQSAPITPQTAPTAPSQGITTVPEQTLRAEISRAKKNGAPVSVIKTMEDELRRRGKQP